MTIQVKYFDFTLPDSLALKHLLHWHGFAVIRSAIVQPLNRHLKAR